MRLFLIICCFLTLVSTPVSAAVEITLRGQQAAVIEDVYQLEGVSYVALEDLLRIAGLTGQWDAVAHLYRVHTRRGVVTLTPASSYMRTGDTFVPLQDKPVFIDGRLRVSESFIPGATCPAGWPPGFFSSVAATTTGRC